jgi:ABC-2 type transport system ATP-binding protein
MFGRLYHLTGRLARRRADELLERFDLAEAAGRPVKTYSGGMRRRLDLAASLIVAPPVLFLDEPTTGIDPGNRLRIWELIGELVAGGTTVLLTTQYLDEADRLADQIVLIHEGRVAAAGTPAQLKSSIGGDRVHVELRDRNHLARAAAVLRDAAGMEPDLHAEEAWLSLPGDAAVLIRVAKALDGTSVAVEDISLRHPTLDEVFLHVTSNDAILEAAR